ncbi:unnamed protein product [Prunus armeniaca]
MKTDGACWCERAKIETTKSHEFAQAAFRGYKSLNRIQSRIFRTVCAPTGAGKTNIAVISILHESLAHQLAISMSSAVKINSFYCD